MAARHLANLFDCNFVGKKYSCSTDRNILRPLITFVIVREK